MPNSSARPTLIFLIVTATLGILAVVSQFLIPSASAYGTFSQMWVGDGTGSHAGGTWLGEMDFNLTSFASNGFAHWSMTGTLPYTGTVVVNYDCTGAPDYQNGWWYFQVFSGLGVEGSSSAFTASECDGQPQVATIDYSHVGGTLDRFSFQGGWFSWMTMHIHSITINGEPLYTDAPPIATSMPQLALPCVTGTVAATSTVQPTLTPYGRATLTATVTSTPGGPTPTPRAPVSGTASYDSGTLNFAHDVSQLSAMGTVNDPSYAYKFLRWSDALGHDGDPGAAWFHTNVGTVTTVTVADLNDHSGVVGFTKTGAWSSPVAVSLYARTAYTMAQGQDHFIRVWYLDPNYDGAGTAVWVSQWDEYVQGSNTLGSDVGGLQLSNEWRKFGAVVTAPAGHTITAIGFDDYFAGTGAVGAPCPTYGCVYLDDVHIAYGDAAMFVLPICGSTGGTRTGRGVPLTRTCVIPYIEKDMRAICVAPTTIDLGAWVSYLWCNLVRFFGFYQENTDQVNLIVERQSAVEPFGSIAESGDVYDDLSGVVTNLQASNKPQTQSPIDWIAMMADGSALDHLPQFTVPDIASSAQYMANCPAEAMLSTSTTAGACMALYMMRQTIVITLFQWGLNALFVVGVIALVRGDLEKLAS